jgi:peptide deformylase
MTTLPIVWAPDPILKTKCAHVTFIGEEEKQLMKDMLDTMYAAPGVGLAAPQVGITKRIIVIDCARTDEPAAPYQMVNPELIKSSMDELANEEGCLSLPGHYADVSRPATARVKYLDENGCQQIIDADGLLAVCIQHEIDHINGILFVDHLSSLKRNMILKKMVKAKRER